MNTLLILLLFGALTALVVLRRKNAAPQSVEASKVQRPQRRARISSYDAELEDLMNEVGTSSLGQAEDRFNKRKKEAA